MLCAGLRDVNAPGHWWFAVAYALRNLGLTAFAQADYVQTAKKFLETLAISRKAGDKFEIAFALYDMGKVAQSQDDLILARKLNSEAIAIFRECDPTDLRKGVVHCLGAFAALAVAQNQWGQSTHLFGAAENLYPPLRFEMSAKERAEHDRVVATARASLGEAAFTAAWEEGKKLTLEEAVAYALKELQ